MKTLTLVLALAFAACTISNTTDSMTAPAQSAKTITVIGTLTSEGVECQAMREEKTNELYTLAGKLDSFHSGDRVKVAGTIAEVSTCMQGKTIAVDSITAAP